MVFLSPGGSTIAAESDPETVVLLHGLGRTHRAMAPLERRLRAEGFEVHNLRYASTGGEPGELVRAVRSSWESCCSDARVVHFVGQLYLSGKHTNLAIRAIQDADLIVPWEINVPRPGGEVITFTDKYKLTLTQNL